MVLHRFLGLLKVALGWDSRQEWVLVVGSERERLSTGLVQGFLQSYVVLIAWGVLQL